MKKSVLITGITGFIGSHTAEHFLEAGYRVGGLIRKDSSSANIDHLEIQREYGSVEDYSQLCRIVQRYDAVIHIAAWAADWGPWERFRKTNVEGTLNVLKAAHGAGHTHVIITGSISTYGEEDYAGEKDEAYPNASHYPYFMDRMFPCKMNYYRDSKAEAKAQAIQFAQSHSLNLTVIEPTWVYGEREFSSGFYEYMDSVRSGMFFMPGSRKNRFHLVYVKDLARAYRLALEKEPEGVQTFIIGNSQAPLMHEVYSGFCREAGLKAPLLMPKWLFYPLGFAMELIYTLFNSQTAPVLTRGRVNMFYDNIVYTVEKSQRILGFSCETELKDGIHKTVQWYKENGYLKE